MSRCEHCEECVLGGLKTFWIPCERVRRQFKATMSLLLLCKSSALLAVLLPFGVVLVGQVSPEAEQLLGVQKALSH